MNAAPHESLVITPYHALSGRLGKIFPHVQRSISKVPAVHNILNTHEATRMEVDMANKQGNLCQTIQADKQDKPRTGYFHYCSRVRVRGRPYTSSQGPSRKQEPRLFIPLNLLEHLPDADNYKLHVPPSIVLCTSQADASC